MGRKKRKKNNNLRNLGLFALIATLGIYGYLTFMNSGINIHMPSFDFSNKLKNESRIHEPIISTDLVNKNEQATPKELPQVKIYFIGHKTGKDIYRPVLRTNDSGRSNIEYAVGCLLKGPTKYEKDHGIYSEVPQALLLSVNETESKVIINLSDTFGYGGGADSLYKRMYQLIKTVNYNTNKPVYLLINGQLAETIGGEGLMIKQPLSGSSLDD